MKEQFSIECQCLFCKAPLQGPEHKTYASGDLIKCLACGEDNDYDSVLEVAKEKGIAEVRKEVEQRLRNELKKIFK